MTHLHIIALCGEQGAGKDAAADVLVNHCRFTKLAFADAVRAEIFQAYDLTAEEQKMFSDRTLKEQPTVRLALLECNSFGFIGAVARHIVKGSEPFDALAMFAPRSPRQIMRWWGTEYRREERPNYWTSGMLQTINGLQRAGTNRLVITDCRFENEAATVRRVQGVVWHVHRPSTEAPDRSHASSQPVDALQPSVVIHNHGDLYDLKCSMLAAWWGLEAGLGVRRLELAP